MRFRRKRSSRFLQVVNDIEWRMAKKGKGINSIFHRICQNVGADKDTGRYDGIQYGGRDGIHGLRK